jgi:hypothetical protein
LNNIYNISINLRLSSRNLLVLEILCNIYMSLKNKTIPMIVIAVTLVASAVVGINNIPAVKADPAQGSFGDLVRTQAQHNQGSFGQHQSEAAQSGLCGGPGLGGCNGHPK